MVVPTSSDDVSSLAREADVKRDELIGTIDRIKSHVAGTTDELKQRLSPDHIKSEAKQYVVEKGQSWVRSVEGAARENPLQAIAIGAGLAYPLFAMARAIPKPLLAIGIGAALLRYKPLLSLDPNVNGSSSQAGNVVADRLSDGLSAANAKVSDLKTAAMDRVDAAAQTVGDARTQLAAQANATAARLSDTIGGAADKASALASDVGEAVKVGLSRSLDTASDVARQTREAAKSAPSVVLDAVRENALAFAGIGLLVGAAVAAAIPATEAEEKVLGPLGSSLKDRAHDLVDQGLDALSTKVGDTYDAVVAAADQQGLNVETARRAVAEVQDRVESVARTASADDRPPSPKPTTVSPVPSSPENIA